ncbi:MAG TPA: hypothetical protein H9818_09340 [Candidatus Phocaeicola gallistercoris]|nr:hypothetical protein [Candidatus Phocaeicola gallistercoris]
MAKINYLSITCTCDLAPILCGIALHQPHSFSNNILTHKALNKWHNY